MTCNDPCEPCSWVRNFDEFQRLADLVIPRLFDERVHLVGRYDHATIRIGDRVLVCAESQDGRKHPRHLHHGQVTEVLECPLGGKDYRIRFEPAGHTDVVHGKALVSYLALGPGTFAEVGGGTLDCRILRGPPKLPWIPPAPYAAYLAPVSPPRPDFKPADPPCPVSPLSRDVSRIRLFHTSGTLRAEEALKVKKEIRKDRFVVQARGIPQGMGLDG